MLDSITRPTLLLDIEKMKSNLDFMVSKANRLNVTLVPHFKTHQSKEIGQYFLDRGIEAITVSSVQMAEYFAENGWKDITVAFPFNRLETAAINRLIAAEIKIKLLITDRDTVAFLADHLEGSVDLFIELDTGYNRSGVDSDDIATIKLIVDEMAKSEKTAFYGLYLHPGNTYAQDSLDEIKSLWADAIQKINQVRDALTLSGVGDILVRMGDKPGCCVVDEMDGVDEIGPGNFVFYDLVMNYLNVCKESDIAVAVACPVVAKHDGRKELVIHGGAVHFSKDHLFDENEHKFFGEVVILEDSGWSSIIPDSKLVSISQEHGVLKVCEDLFNILEVGDVVGILPIHSCLTANLMSEYVTLSKHRLTHMSGRS